MKFTNVLNLPEPIVAAVTNDPYDRGESDFSITGLLKPARISALEDQHRDELVEDVADRIYALLGQSVAKILETAGVKVEGETREHRLYMDLDVDGKIYRISGQTDRVVALPDHTIQDWKLASVREAIFGVKPERLQQLNGYAALYRTHGYNPTKLQDVFVFRDWSKSKALEAAADPESDYPTKQVMVADIPLWEPEIATEFLRRRVRAHVQARTTLPFCTDEERWKDPDKVAVMKGKLKRAVKTFASMNEATAWVSMQNDKAEMRYESRTFEPKRCALGYCPVTAWCSQWKGESA